MGSLQIRRARRGDLAVLPAELGPPYYFLDRFDRQEQGLGALLVAWRDDRPIGVLYIWLEPAEEPEIREHLPGTPLLTHLEIHTRHRKQGTGTKLLEDAERRLRLLGHRRVALAVEENNNHAARLYTRLGYEEWPHPTVKCYAIADKEGNLEIEFCRVLVKTLP
jgi:GNAT superfamily N-acetyltransferase